MQTKNEKRIKKYLAIAAQTPENKEVFIRKTDKYMNEGLSREQAIIKYWTKEEEVSEGFARFVVNKAYFEDINKLHKESLKRNQSFNPEYIKPVKRSLLKKASKALYLESFRLFDNWVHITPRTLEYFKEALRIYGINPPGLIINNLLNMGLISSSPDGYTCELLKK